MNSYVEVKIFIKVNKTRECVIISREIHARALKGQKESLKAIITLFQL